ncbi:MAG: site-specific integrase [Desulfobacteraceae bacterium]|nr:site-specific integrase [Desulfobacteraceae bacterium]
MTLILNKALYHYNKFSKEKKNKEAKISRLCANRYCKALIECNCDYQFKHVHDPTSVSFFPGKSTGTKSRKTNSKRKSLVGLPKNWQEKVYKNISIKYRDALLILMLTGCRPDELFKGVSLSISEGFIKADILGSKVTDTKGYKYRSLFFEPNSNFASHKIKYLLGQRGPHIINLGNDDLNNSEKFKGRFNKAIKYAAKKNGVKFNDISPYSFRHQKAADLKKEQYEDVKIAFFLGHKSKRMQRHYGFYSQGKGSTGLAYAYATNNLEPTMTPEQ